MNKTLVFGTAFIVLCGLTAGISSIANGSINLPSTDNTFFYIVVGMFVVFLFIAGMFLRWISRVDELQELEDVTTQLEAQVYNLVGVGTVVENRSKKIRVVIRESVDKSVVYIHDIDSSDNILPKPLIVPRAQAAREINRKIRAPYERHRTVDWEE